MHPGMKTRYDRIVNPQTGKTVLLPFDHGLPFGPLPGITDPRQTVGWAAAGGANAIIFNQGLANSLFPAYNTQIATIHMLTNSCALEHAPPVVGGVLLGMEQAGLDAPALRETLIQSSMELLSTRSIS